MYAGLGAREGRTVTLNKSGEMVVFYLSCGGTGIVALPAKGKDDTIVHVRVSEFPMSPFQIPLLIACYQKCPFGARQPDSESPCFGDTLPSFCWPPIRRSWPGPRACGSSSPFETTNQLATSCLANLFERGHLLALVQRGRHCFKRLARLSSWWLFGGAGCTCRSLRQRV